MQVFLDSLASASSSMMVAAAWVIAIIGFLIFLLLLALIHNAVFDLSTRLLVWIWRKTNHSPKGRIQRILMRGSDGIQS